MVVSDPKDVGNNC